MKTFEQKRPSSRDQDVVASAVDALLPSVWDWYSSTSEENSDYEREAVKNDLIKVITNSYDLDAYVLAKKLENQHYWEPDSTLVDILTILGQLLQKCHKDAMKLWVKENNIIPQKKVGDDVVVDVVGTSRSGKIISVDNDTAHYCVNIPSLGHTEHEFTTVDGVCVANPKKKDNSDNNLFTIAGITNPPKKVNFTPGIMGVLKLVEEIDA